MINKRHLDLLEKRGISVEIASKLGWESSGEMLAIPYFQAGKKVGVKYRTLDGEKRFFQEKGSYQIFYNWDALRDNGVESIIITEGEMDCAIALQCGLLAVSVPNGAPMEPVANGDTKYDYLKDLPKDKEIIIAVDDDNPGRNLLHDLSIRIGQHKCKWVKYPKECKDLNDAYMKYGVKGVVESINRAQWMKIDGIYSMDDLPEPPMLETTPCPVDGLGNHYLLRQGDLAVITGIPGLGKTTLVNEIAANSALRNKWNVAIASFEQNPKTDHRRALRTFYNSSPAKHQTEEELAKADEWIGQKFTFIVPSMEDEVDLKWVLDKCEAAIVRNHCKLIVIDPWNEMDHIRPDGMSMTEYTGFAIKQFKKLARRLLVHVIVVAHPAKMYRNKDGSYPAPSLYDIADSAHFYNKPDIGMVVHRNDDNTMLFRVQKCRYVGVIGKPGDVNLKFNPDRYSFEEVCAP